MTFLDDARKAIHNAGGRMTPQRRLIISLLESSDARLDAEELHRLANQQDADISLATVYRTLNTLEEAQLIQYSYLSRDHERKYYELVHQEKTYQFVCRECGRTYPFRSRLIQALKDQLENDLSVRVLQTCLCIEGLCPDCQDKQAQERQAGHSLPVTVAGDSRGTLDITLGGNR
jgi:Fur family ferric uptake transcriptional regulator